MGIFDNVRYRPVWCNAKGSLNYRSKHDRYRTRRGATNFGNRMSNEYGWGKFYVEAFTPVPKLKQNWEVSRGSC